MATDNMNLTIPVVDETVGPDYAEEVNGDLELIDEHDHSTGKGVLIKPSGININDDLPFNQHNATELNSTQYENLSVGTDVPNAGLYVKSGDIWYKNAGGTEVQITSGSSVNASTDGISRSFEGDAMNSNTAIDPSDTFSMIYVDTTSGVTITLPAANAVSDGRFYEIHDITGSAASNNIVINRAGSDTIDGGTQYKISQAYGSIRLTSNGSSKWALNVLKFTASKFLVSDANGNISTSAVASTVVPQTITNWGSDPWTVSTTWTTNTTTTGFYRRVGDTLEGRIQWHFTGAPQNTGLTFELPPTLNANTTLIPGVGLDDDLAMFYGYGSLSDSGGTIYNVGVRFSSSTTFALKYQTASAQWAALSRTAPITIGSGDDIWVWFSMPITQWA